jgi:hypothetical protein
MVFVALPTSTKGSLIRKPLVSSVFPYRNLVSLLTIFEEVHPRQSAYANGKSSAEEPANLNAAERQSFFAGQPLQPRMSIE